MARYQPKNSENNSKIEVYELEIVEEKKSSFSTQTLIAMGVLFIAAVLIITYAAYGFLKEDPTVLKDVFMYIQSPIAVIIGYYFGAKHEVKKHD